MKQFFPRASLSEGVSGGSATALELANAEFRRGDYAAGIAALMAQRQDAECRALLVEYWVAARDVPALLGLFQSVPTEPLQQGLEQAVRAHFQGDPARAAQQCAALLQQSPGHPRVLNHFARALFNLGRRDQALAALREAVSKDPGYVQALNNLGHVERALGQSESALQLFRRAVDLSPGFVEARLNLAVTLLGVPRPDEALVEFEAVLQNAPTHPDALVNCGSCLHMLRRYQEAEQRYRQAIDCSPPGELPLLAWRQLAKLYVETARIEKAVESLQTVLRLAPDLAELHAELVSTLEVANRLDEAEQVVQSALQRFPQDPVLRYEAAKIERRRGNAEQALTRLMSIPAAAIPPHLQQWFHFERGTAFDECARYDEAFAAFLESNRHARLGMRARLVDMQALDRIFDALQDWTADGAPAPVIEPDEDLGEDLVFLLGFPRSGTTLLDLMLDGHEQIQSLEERQTMEEVFWQVDQRHGGFPHGLASTSAEDRARLRQHYRRRLAEEGIKPQPGGIVVDKMPMRSAYLAFINRLFPRARFLFALRHPLDVVLSNFMQNYAANDVFAHFHSIEEIARVYARVMQIWQQTQGCIAQQSWMYVRYEDLVEDRDAVLQQVCRFLDIEWRPEMGDHLRTLSSRPHIKTNSYQQVTRPIYRRSRGRWVRYAQHLSPIQPVLAPYLALFGYPEGEEGLR
ncbi:tetratricopeptide repeat-containing sulfotransferase family protein [Pseudomarimonas arenosa]|uniref:Sulfotransferase n=1 Tax=Pseudomarimonas arenosa TaxID=2774145 RepID=A0AAW3ZIB9_9GAMM|nr:tetratricopeptide repeat-containing sulfotransferase family protein [Pseudomarimonas arenosa]MBD8524979.1 sulfotransferase [Pseudomarimonas arenosa]